MVQNEIPVFETSNDLHEATGYDHRSHIPGFDIFTLESLEPTARKCMPPYRQGFFQIGILSNTGKSQININTNAVNLSELPLWFVVPGQVFSWFRDIETKGYHVQFRKEFIAQSIPNLTGEFPFLKLSENSVFLMTPEEQKSLEVDMERMHSVFHNPHPYQERMLQGMLTSVLYNCKSVYERYKTTESHLSRGQVLTQQFQQLVDKLYVDSRNVGDYAEQLNVTPNYLTTTVKQITGKTAKDVIQERIFLESKTMLSFTSLDVAEIAYQLNFQEPTHFTRFFKKHSGTTPNKFRKSI
ncbi:helix-turn-helix domain-containing protein [Flagellimonas meridianipacifica]|uniref:AraC-like DNA-binding protein n=1 Tax=Flagellimonas meridianipacifica TaxID=1080225 RepID=A0A2T0MBJ2_9FLAO|nr:helix-turn-helix domain-containing protein [Allomuricauda pacifica]PRX54845.1 AraC-like DNA-binding protein [Allomuricauda pacifica]